MTTQRWTADRAGTIFEGSSTRTADELNACVIMLAADNGWLDDGSLNVALALVAQEDTTGVRWCDTPEDAEALAEGAVTACEWMDENIAPAGYTFEFDDGFLLIAD